LDRESRSIFVGSKGGDLLAGKNDFWQWWLFGIQTLDQIEIWLGE
jgi:hypothetical protein